MSSSSNYAELPNLKVQIFLQIKIFLLIFPPGTPQRVISRLEEERKMKSRSSGVHISGFFVSDVPAFQKTLEKPVEDIVNHGLVSNSGDFIISNSSTPSPSPFPSNDHSTTNSASATCTKSDDDRKQTRKEAILKKVFDEIKSKFNDSGIDIERTTNSGVIEMKFKHVDRHWLIRFPESFPETRASIFSCHSDNFSNAIENYSSKPDFLNNYVDILLAIKRECKFVSSNCSSCRRVDVQSLTLSDPTLDLFLTKVGNAKIPFPTLGV